MKRDDASLRGLPGIRRDVPLAPFTTYRIGGPADFWIAPTTKERLAEAVIAAREACMPYLILGQGANILVGDKGFQGLVIKNEVAGVRWDGNAVTAGSGATMADLIEASARRGLSGLEHFAGIPSSVGGALWQNLHFLAPDRMSTAYIASVLGSAELLDEENAVLRVAPAFFEFGYDESVLHRRQLALLEATFSLEPSTEDAVRRQAEENLAWRRAKHPPLSTLPSSGSVFKKIEGVGAGRLIEQAGLKGFRIGGAEVSAQHANFIVNVGGATARDVRDVIETVQERVARETGYRLEPEIGFVGEF